MTLVSDDKEDLTDVTLVSERMPSRDLTGVTLVNKDHSVTNMKF